MSGEEGIKTLAILITCHNRRSKTLSCLSALKKQTINDSFHVEVYLLDDGSTDGTSEAVGREFPDVIILHGDGSLFWNRGMRKAFAAAIQKGFDYYLWLNDDSIIYDNSIGVLLDTHAHLTSQGHECSIIGSAMQDPDSHQFTYGGVRRYKKPWGRIKLERISPSDEAIQCDATNGNCVLIPASVVEKVGNLDKVYQHRWGDHDYCFRALDCGCSVWLAPGYLGSCKDNPVDGTWEDISLSLMDRLRKINSPQAYQFRDYAIYMRRHRGAWWPAHLVWPYLKVVLQAIKQ